MCQSQREGSWATYNFASCVVLGAVARAHELVLSPVPWHHATQVCADSVESVIFDLLVLGNNEVGGIAPDTLDQLAGLCVILFQPSLKCDNISKCICSGHTCASTAFCWREEEGDVAKEAPPVWNRDGTESEQVQDGSPLHVRNEVDLRAHLHVRLGDHWNDGRALRIGLEELVQARMVAELRVAGVPGAKPCGAAGVKSSCWSCCEKKRRERCRWRQLFIFISLGLQSARLA
mmetsp:Transcript_56832/g.103921  ORF Transcript_56832/g.103921 Transcript_56832/m.103921 type:complete len:233 (-) Transcript_56832:142-840(-)